MGHDGVVRPWMAVRRSADTRPDARDIRPGAARTDGEAVRSGVTAGVLPTAPGRAKRRRNR